MPFAKSIGKGYKFQHKFGFIYTFPKVWTQNGIPFDVWNKSEKRITAQKLVLFYKIWLINRFQILVSVFFIFTTEDMCFVLSGLISAEEICPVYV